MLFLLIILFLTATVAIAISATILKKRSKSLPPAEIPNQIQTPIEYKSIFAPDEAEIRAFKAAESAELRETARQNIVKKAEMLEFDALIEAKEFEPKFYDWILTEIVLRADEKLFASLGLFIEKNELRTNAEFIQRFQSIYENSPSKKHIVRLLHFAARSESAEIFSGALDDAMRLLREDELRDFTLRDLARLAESEFWLLPPSEKISGAGFLLKQRLAKLRAEVQEK